MTFQPALTGGLFRGRLDSSPAISIGSTLTYLQRYTLIQALGLAASDDDDGAKSENTAKAENM